MDGLYRLGDESMDGNSPHARLDVRDTFSPDVRSLVRGRRMAAPVSSRFEKHAVPAITTWEQKSSSPYQFRVRLVASRVVTGSLSVRLDGEDRACPAIFSPPK